MQLILFFGAKANDYLILNDFYLKVAENKYRHIDTMLFANKYIYIIKEIKVIGEIKMSLNDMKWRLIYQDNLENIDNPLMSNQSIINHLIRITKGFEPKDFKNIVLISKTANFDASSINNLNSDYYVFSEKEIIKGINKIEKESNDDIMDPKEVERYVNFFYNYGKSADKIVKEYKKRNEKRSEI